MDEQTRRQQEVAAKRARVQALRKQREERLKQSMEKSASSPSVLGRDSLSSPRQALQQQLSAAAPAENVDALVDDLIGSPAPPAPADAAEPAQPSAAAATEPAQDRSAVAGASEPRRKLVLMDHECALVGFEPRIVERYSKETQTSTVADGGASSGSGSDDDDDMSEASSSARDADAPDDDDEDEFVDAPEAPDGAVASSSAVAAAEPVATAETKDLSNEERRTILMSETFQAFFGRATTIMERALEDETAAHMFVDYAQDGESDARADGQELVRVSTVLRDDKWTRHRSVSDVCWSAKHPELLLASYNAKREGLFADSGGLVLVWSLLAKSRPEYVFECQSAVNTALFNPHVPTAVFGGTYSGQIVQWDTRAKSAPVQRTPPSDQAHTHPVYAMSIVGTQNAHNIVSASTDGRVCVWAPEMMGAPIETLDLSVPSKRDKSVAVCALAFPPNEVNRFLVGAEDGTVYQAARHGNAPGVQQAFPGHFGPVSSVDVQRVTEFDDVFLTAGTDWTCKLWSTKHTDGPLHTFDDSTDYVLDASWCPSNAGVFASADADGFLSVWDLVQTLELPVVKLPLGEGRALTRVRWAHDGKRIVTGDSAGNLSICDAAASVSSSDLSRNARLSDVLRDLRASASNVAPSS